ncbi:MAG: hypothetical protein QG619_506, partial [Pseudomonadota bacterium]|nr:hypothetical protein [Pseudomonadota bacterium]
MKTGIAIVSLAAALFALPVMAQPGPGGGAGMGPGGSGQGAGPGAGPGGGKRQPMDCSKSKNPEACTAHQEARKKAMEACKDK